jgi:formylglycine-generating enzyme required for sulfatase activity
MPFHRLGVMSQLFISYRRDDSTDVTGRIYDRLVGRYGAANIFRDLDAIPLGTDFRKHLTQAVRRCAVLLAVIGRQWLDVTTAAGKRRLDDERDFVRIEIEAALQRDIPVIPVLVQGAEMPPEEQLPPSLQELVFRQAAVVRRDPDFHRDVDRLIRELDRVIQRATSPETSPEVTRASADGPRARPELPLVLTNSIGMELALIPPGQFRMGSPQDEENHQDDEIQHEVTLTKPFYLGVHQVTQEQYERVMGSNPSYFSAKRRGKDKGQDTKRFPVESVSWDDAAAFCRTLSDLPEEKQHKRLYLLPTEAQWEYACREGGSSKTPFHFGAFLSSELANFDGNFPYGGAAKGDYLERTTTVGSYKPNKFGLYDMHGNVWEWCADSYDKDFYRKEEAKVDPENKGKDGDRRVLRGGSWFNDGRDCRAAYRNYIAPDNRINYIGFRVFLVAGARTP